MKYPILILFSFIALIALFSCNKKDKNNEYENFAKTLEASIIIGDPDFFNKHFNLEKTLENTIKDIVVTDSFKQGFTSGVIGNLNVGEQIISSLGLDGDYKFLHLKNTPNNGTSALFRVASSGGVNYHELFLTGSGDNISIEDFCIYISGLKFTTTLRQLYLSSIAHDKTNLKFDSTSLPLADKAFITYQKKLNDISTYIDFQKYDSAYILIQKLPEVLLRDKSVILMELMIANKLDPSTLQKTIDKYNQYFPNDPTINLMLMDFNFENKNYAETLVLIDSLDKKINGDPFLNVLKADIFIAQKKYPEAEELLKKCIEKEPNSEKAYWDLVLVYLDQKKYADAVKLFPEVQKQIGLNPAEFLPQEPYKDFWQSPEYLVWQKEHPIDSSGMQAPPALPDSSETDDAHTNH